MNARAAAAPRKVRRVMITRSKQGNEELRGRLEELGFKVVALETMRFLPPGDWSPVDESLSGLSSFDWLVITSPIGADSFLQRMRWLSLAVPWVEDRPAVATVGAKTRDALRSAGVRVDFVPTEYTTRALAEELPRDRGKELLLLRADIADPDFVTSLKSDGFEVREHAIYRTDVRMADPASAAQGRDENDGSGGGRDGDGDDGDDGDDDDGPVDAIIFASPSAVEAFVAMRDPARLRLLNSRGVLAACIGPVTARAAQERGFEHILISKVHTLDDLIRELGVAEVQG
jgi:uroporphyrinogen III methyltransferase / synthase